ncbi:MAG: phytoene desaturase [Chloroflexi bacterium]|nr:phytoene desaturase [Chloroflexota bacterium]
MTSVIIIGSGLGGLAAALRLQHAGFQVTLFEKQTRPGGRSSVIEEHGFRVDTGPTILVMKDTFEETYAAVGQDMNRRLDMIQIDPNYRIYFHDDTHVDLYANMAELAAEVERIEPGAAESLFDFIGAGARKYALGMDFVVRNYDHITDIANPRAGLRLLRTGSHRRLYKQVGHYFKSDKLRKAFSFHSMFLGLSPFDALAMYSLITYADLARGMWYPRGGIYSIVEDMVALAEQLGAQICLGTPVQEIVIEAGRAVGVRLESGEVVRADMVVSNADLPYTYKKLVPAAYRKQYTDRRLDKMQYACSGYLLYLGVDKTYSHMRHQALYFSEDYRANLDAIFKTRTLPAAPSFHLNLPTVTDPSLAPEGHSLIYVLAPMPNLQGSVDWNEAAPVVREQLLTQIERLVDPDLRAHIVWEREYTPVDFEQGINAVHGTAFGSFSHGFFQSSYFRPHNKARDIQGLYFVGQGTYPGVGMPMVLLSARLVTERILREWN